VTPNGTRGKNGKHSQSSFLAEEWVDQNLSHPQGDKVDSRILRSFSLTGFVLLDVQALIC
jgi:hypothetical protein